MHIILTTCSAHKLETMTPTPALDLYQGGYVPTLRATMQAAPIPAAIFILSAKHGLLAAQDRILPYDQPLTLERAQELRPQVWADLHRRVFPLHPQDMLIVAEPLYLLLVADLFGVRIPPLRLYWEPDLYAPSPLCEEVYAQWRAHPT